MKRLLEIQQTLNAPKDKFNSFGNYSYRSCEGILEAVKPLLKEKDLVLTITDEIVNVGDKNYIKATVKLTDAKNGNIVDFTTAFARESDTKKGMDDSQITGATSSYARKYALNGLFLIDDSKDADTDEFTKASKELVETVSNLPVYNKSLSNMENGKKETKVEAKTKVTL